MMHPHDRRRRPDLPPARFVHQAADARGRWRGRRRSGIGGLPGRQCGRAAQTDPIEPNGIVVDVQSIDNTFRPDRVVVTPGTEVRWTNLGRTEHDITSGDGTEWVATEAFQPGATYSHIVGGVGELRYYCKIHGTAEYGMIGTIVVVDELPTETTAG